MQNTHPSTHPHAVLLAKLYGHYNQGEIEAALALCDDQFTFQIPGKSVLSGKHSKANMNHALIKRIQSERIPLEIHDILTSDLHATVLLSEKINGVNGPIELRAVHVWRFNAGKPIAGYEYPRDLYQLDQALGVKVNTNN